MVLPTKSISVVVSFLLYSYSKTVLGFTPPLQQRSTTTTFHLPSPCTTTTVTTKSTPIRTSTTQLNVYIDVPPGFFTISLMGMSIMLSVSRSVNRARMEELAWEQRLEEAREKRMAKDPTLLETDLRRQEAANEWSAYGPDAMAEREASSKKKVKVMDYEVELEDDDEYGSTSRNRPGYGMTDEEISTFEREFGIDYDPYYDDPYAEEDLPEDVNFKTDGQYGDRIYANGEIFYKDKATNLYYRQGSKPRISKLW